MKVAFTPTAKTAQQAAAFVGANVRFNPDNSDNEMDPMVPMMSQFDGEVVASNLMNGVLALSVVFDTPMFSGTILAVPAERFIIEANA